MRTVVWILALAAAAALLQDPDALHQEALRLLHSGNAASAEAGAAQAITRSSRFVPEEEIEIRPDRGLLFEEMILEARAKYRERRARYFRTLADALAAQEKWAPARKAYRRSFQISPSAEVPLLVAQHPDLSIAERVDHLLDGYLASVPGPARSSIEAKLLESGAFLSRDALKASLDRKRFPKLRRVHPDLELLESAFPDFQAVTDGGPFAPSELFRAGATLVAYFPAEGCSRCSEELDGMANPLRDARTRRSPIEAAAFVLERELSTARTVTRLLAIPVRVGRKDGLPPSLDVLDAGEIRVVARGGLTSIRIPMSPIGEAPSSFEIRQRLEAILAFLGEAGLPTEARPEESSLRIVNLPRGDLDEKSFLSWVDALSRLEAGPAPLGDLHAELARLVQRLVPETSSREDVLERVDALSRLRGANVAKTRLLGLLGNRIGERLLEHAKSLDPSVRRSLSGEEGVFHLALRDARFVYLQRSFAAAEGIRELDFVLEEEGSDLRIVWGAASEREPLGVDALAEGGAFFFACATEGAPRCSGARLVSGGRVIYEGEPVAVIEGRLVALENALVDELPGPESGPLFHRDVVSDGESALSRGLRLFQAGDFAAAALAFEEAEKEIDPAAPYDASDLAYNRGRALQEAGKRREALQIFRGIGDVSYQDRVDEQARLIESGR